MKSVQEIWHPATVSSNELLAAAAHSCVPNSVAPNGTIINFAHARGVSVRATPMHVIHGDTTYAVYHNGHLYEIYAVGEPVNILNVCRMGENQREKALLESRRMENDHSQVLGIAHGSVTKAPTYARDIKGLSFRGLVSVF